jgi:hypothetical protein
MDETSGPAYIAYVQPAGERTYSINIFDTEDEADVFGVENSSGGYVDPEYEDRYDQPIVILMEAKDRSAMDSGKFTRPVAIYQRGEKYACVKVPINQAKD